MQGSESVIAILQQLQSAVIDIKAETTSSGFSVNGKESTL